VPFYRTRGATAVDLSPRPDEPTRGFSVWGPGPHGSRTDEASWAGGLEPSGEKRD